MVSPRRQFLRTTAAASLATLAGCSTSGRSGSDTAATEYVLSVDPVDAAPTAHALYTPDDDELFGAPAREALDDILHGGRHTTYGYRPLPSDAYVEHDGSYYQTKHVVTGRERLERSIVRVERLSEERVPAETTAVDALERPSARVLKILHSHAVTDGEGGGSELLRDEGYVLRRPAEVASRLGTGDLDGDAVSMTESGSWAYRIEVSTEPVLETAYAAFAVEVADSREAFREVVFAAEIDADLDAAAIGDRARERLERAIDRGSVTDTVPLSDPFAGLLDALNLADVETVVNGRLLWYEGALYRYGLYVDDSS